MWRALTLLSFLLISQAAYSQVPEFPVKTFGPDPIMIGKKGTVVPQGTSADRPPTPSKGTIRFNTSLNSFEGWDGTSWTPLGSGASSPVFATWTTAGRPATPFVGQVGYNLTLATPEYWNGTVWAAINSSGGDGSTMPISSFSGAGTAVPGMNFCNSTGGSFTLTLPSAALNSGRIIEVKKTDVSANTVIVLAAGIQTIDLLSSYTLGMSNQCVSIISDGSNWKIK